MGMGIGIGIAIGAGIVIGAGIGGAFMARRDEDD